MVFDAMRWDEMKWIVQYKDIQIKTEALAKAKAKTLAWYDNLGLMWMMCACIHIPTHIICMWKRNFIVLFHSFSIHSLLSYVKMNLMRTAQSSA